jgi:hypothetical protein
MPCCRRHPGGSPRPCVGGPTGCGDCGPDSLILIMHALTRRSGVSGRQAGRSIRSAADQVWLRHQRKDRLFPPAPGTWARCMPLISRLRGRSVPGVTQ